MLSYCEAYCWSLSRKRLNKRAHATNGNIDGEMDVVDKDVVAESSSSEEDEPVRIFFRIFSFPSSYFRPGRPLGPSQEARTPPPAKLRFGAGASVTRAGLFLPEALSDRSIGPSPLRTYRVPQSLLVRYISPLFSCPYLS